MSDPDEPTDFGSAWVPTPDDTEAVPAVAESVPGPADAPTLEETFERRTEIMREHEVHHGQAIIELLDVRKTYSTGSLSVEALRGVSLRINEGEFVAVIGPSGSGKSTLMHILGCLDVPSAGRYLLSGQDVSHMKETELAHVRNQRIGFVFQQFHLLPSMAAWRNVELPLAYASVPRATRKELAVAALQRVGLGERVEHRPNELSGGQQQRVAVARALVTDPDLVLADEPTGNLDTAATAEILGLFHELHQAGRTVVLITHEPDVAAVASRTIRVRDGMITEGTANRELAPA